MTNKFRRVLVIEKLLSLFLMLFLGASLFSSCKIFKPAYYFKDIRTDTIIRGFVNADFELKIQKNDVLTISVSSLSAEEDVLFNKSVGGVEGKSGFQVNLDGNIYLHKLGKVAVAGLTRKQLKSKLETELLPYLKDPIITVSFANHRITVLGETGSKMVDMPDEKIALLEVLAQGGGTSQNAQLDKIMIIRETQNTKEIKHLNLEDPSIFTSPWYYLQPNDIVVVKPNEAKIDAEQKRTRNQLLYTTVLSGITFVFLLIDRIFR